MKLFPTIAILMFLFSCNSRKTRFVSKDAFQDYINNPENGFVQHSESEELIFEAKLTPPLNREKSKECTINLRIKRKDRGGVLDLGGVDRKTALEREGYLSFDLRNDVVLKIGNRSIQPVFHHYERNYGLKPSVDIVFNFMGLGEIEDATLYYRDKIFNQGLIKIEFDKELFKTCYVE